MLPTFTKLSKKSKKFYYFIIKQNFLFKKKLIKDNI